MNTKEQIIEVLSLKPHPEGGYFKETYRSSGKIKTDSLHPSYSSDRNYSTCIYFLLTSENFSAFHKIKQDEIWHFYYGAPIRLHMISPEGDLTTHSIGTDFSNNETPQLIVPGGYWFAAEVIKTNAFALVGCTVAPGFSFEDFELISEKELSTLFPEHNTVISKFTNH
ncbi:cupin domain-containing protein [uncultured Psychroserpens sp.]|uniref:cupin domain-containing protein n=1 Tax=uncultured Psychroserpens sp. TaxID=255436 RepID=UPI002628EF34|nr:cupin domain-containing protein [uncultured Psychroserpens sp.]